MSANSGITGRSYSVTVYGHSDDCIEVEGCVREEFSAWQGNDDAKGFWLAFGDGTLLRIVYDDEGCWRVSVSAPGKAAVVRVQEGDPDGEYTDKVRLDWSEPFTWVLCSDREPARAKREFPR